MTRPPPPPRGSSPGDRSTVTLRSQAFGEGADAAGPLSDDDVRRIVVASAQAIAERTGVALHGASIEGHVLSLTIQGPTLVAIGFAAEVRRVTEAWHRAKYGHGLWGGEEASGR